MVSHCSFDLHFPADWWCWTSLDTLIGHLHIFFGEMYIQALCPFLSGFLLLTFSSLCILDINPFSAVWFANIFCHSVGCLFTLLILLFDAQKYNFHKVQFVYIFFCCLCLWHHIQEIIAESNVVKFLPYIFFYVFYYFRFYILGQRIHFELIFVFGVS